MALIFIIILLYILITVLTNVITYAIIESWKGGIPNMKKRVSYRFSTITENNIMLLKEMCPGRTETDLVESAINNYTIGLLKAIGDRKGMEIPDNRKYHLD